MLIISLHEKFWLIASWMVKDEVHVLNLVLKNIDVFLTLRLYQDASFDVVLLFRINGTQRVFVLQWIFNIIIIILLILSHI